MAPPSFTPTTIGQLTIIVVPAVVLPFTVLAVALRFHSRALTRQNLGPDDWLVLLALVLVFGLYVDMIISVVWGGLGVSIFTLTPKTIEIFAKVLSEFLLYRLS